ncbi:MAG: hypothetical protein PVI57_20520 [Gemmatimonadota bacterium]|jgi:hypothetical protein
MWSSSRATAEPPSASPADCALLIGIPLEREQFDRDLAAPDRYDFAARIKARYGLSTDGAWRLYGRSAAYARRVCDEVAGRGVTVVRSAGIDELRSSFRGSGVVSLAGHTRLVPLCDSDVEDPDRLQQRILAGRDLISSALRAELHSALGDSPWPRAELLAALASLSERAHRALGEEHPFATGGMPATGGSVPVEHLNRVTLETTYGDAVRASEVVELRDGLHPLSSFIEAISDDWSGVLDLTLCNSAVLAPWIKRHRRRCLVVANRGSASLDVRLARYHVTIKSLDREPRPFVETLGRVHRTLTERGES